MNLPAHGLRDLSVTKLADAKQDLGLVKAWVRDTSSVFCESCPEFYDGRTVWEIRLSLEGFTLGQFSF